MHNRKLLGTILLLLGITFGLIAHPLVGKVLAQVVNTQVYACVKDNGLVRISTASTTCGTGETLVVWNIQGPQGPQGPAGPAGGSGIGGFDPAKLTNNYISGAEFSYKKFDNADFSNSLIANGMDQASFRNANFTNVIFTYTGQTGGAPKMNVDFTNANFTGAKFNNSIQDPFGRSFYRTNFTNANFTNANLHYTDSISRFPELFFGGFSLNNQNGRNDFSQSNFSGATWSNTVCADDTNSDANGGTCEGHLITP